MRRHTGEIALVPSFEPLSTTISSNAGRVCRKTDCRQCRVNASWFQQGTMMDARPSLWDMVIGASEYWSSYG